MRLRNFFLTEMPAKRQDPMWAVLDWAAQQKTPFTIRQALQVYVQNGGRKDSLDPEGNIGSFTSSFQKLVAKQHKQGMKPKPGAGPYWPPSDRRPLVAANQGVRGSKGEKAGTFIWALDKPLRDPSTARFVNPEDLRDEESAGDAMDRLENMKEVGQQKLVAAMRRWKGMKAMAAVADIKATLPKKAWMDAMIIVHDMLDSKANSSPEEAEAVEDEIEASAPMAAPSVDDDDDDGGEFSDEEDFEAEPEIEPEPEDEEEPEAPPPAPTKIPPLPTPKAAPPPPPEPEDDDEEDDVEEPTKQQAGAANFLKPSAPAKPASPPAKRPSMGALMKKFKK